MENLSALAPATIAAGEVDSSIEQRKASLPARRGIRRAWRGDAPKSQPQNRISQRSKPK